MRHPSICKFCESPIYFKLTVNGWKAFEDSTCMFVHRCLNLKGYFPFG